MPTYYDNPSSQRATATPKYWDNGAGQRVTLSGGFRLDSVGSTGGGSEPPPPPPPSGGGTRLLGMYPGLVTNDDGVFNALGQYPMVSSTYWQPENYATLSTYEATRMSRGIHSVHLLAAVKDSTAAPTRARDVVNGVINGNPPFFLTDYLTRSEAVARRYPQATMTLHPFGEIEVGFNQNWNGIVLGLAGGKTDQASLFAYYNNNATAILQAYGKYVNGFFDLCDQLAPTCFRSFFMGGAVSASNNANRNTVYSQITNPPSWVCADPYNERKPMETPYETWLPKVQVYTSATGAHNSHWVRWGRPGFAFNETGIAHHRLINNAWVAEYNDAEMATWISGMVDAMNQLDVRHVMYFNSDAGPQTKHGIINSTWGNYPQAKAAFSGEMTKARSAVAA